MNKENNIRIFKPTDKESIKNIFIEDGISAGFPSPASDFEESRISIEKVVVKNRKDCCKDRWAGSYVKLLDNYGNLVKKSKETLSSDKVNASLIDVQEFTFD